MAAADTVHPLLTMMQQAVDRFLLTIAQLTDISKLQQANDQPAEPIELAALIEDVRLDLAPTLAMAGTHLIVDVGACPTISFSPKNLRSIIYNLLSNAVKYRAPDRAPEVRIRCHRIANVVSLEVQDNGLGLDAAQQGKLFQLFRRLHTHVEGSGVGLYMVKRIVENASGTLTVTSTLGVGSTFTVTLPVA